MKTAPLLPLISILFGALTIGAFARADAQPAISVNFYDPNHLEATFVPEDDTFGYAPKSNWTNIPVERASIILSEELAFTDIRSEAGEPSSISLYWPSSDETAGFFATDTGMLLSIERTLLNGYTIWGAVVAGIPEEVVESGYALIVYSDHPSDEELSLEISVTPLVNGELDQGATVRRWGLDSSSTDSVGDGPGTFVVSEAETQESGESVGNVFVFRDLQFSSFRIQARRQKDDASYVRGVVNGFQIVPNP